MTCEGLNDSSHPLHRSRYRKQSARFGDDGSHQRILDEKSRSSPGDAPEQVSCENENEGGETVRGQRRDVEEHEADSDSRGDEYSEDSEDSEEEGSSLSEGGFHSQMSLLSFTGRIRTYSLGSGSGSARSRPRIHPGIEATLPSSEAFSRGRSLVLSDRWPFSHARKRARYQESEGDRQGANKVHVQRVESVAGELEAEPIAAHNSREDIEDEDDWWKSRLQNSAYPEDHNFVSMTTEELISALTTGYHSHLAGDDDEDEDEDEGEGEGESESESESMNVNVNVNEEEFGDSST